MPINLGLSKELDRGREEEGGGGLRVQARNPRNTKGFYA